MSTKRKTIEEVKEYVENNSNCILLSMEYKSNKTPLKFQCKCGNIFYRTFNNFTNNHKMCVECSNILKSNNAKTPYYKVKKYINSEKYGGGCTLLTNKNDYENVNTILTIKCQCGELFYRTFHDFKRLDKQCKKCYENQFGDSRRHDFQYVKNFIEVESNSSCELLDDNYKNSKIKLCIKCKCNNVFKTSFNNFKYRNVRQCRKCSSISYGEDKIRETLDDAKITYIEQYRIHDCRNKLPLPFDFAIFEDEEKTILKYLIEYDGIQHFEPVKLFNKKYGTEYRKTNDKIKNDYCKKNNIELIRIPYWEFKNIENIIINK